MARREYQDPPLRKTKGPHPRWYIRIRKRVVTANGVKKKQVREYFGFCKEIGIREAQHLREKALTQINAQIYTISSHVPLKDFVLKYNATHLPTLGAGTQAKYRLHLTNHIVPAFGAKKLCEVTTEEMQIFLNAKAAEGLSWWTRNDLRNILSGLFTKAADWGYWKEPYNPAAKVDIGRKKPKRQKRLLDDSQALALLAALPAIIALIIRIADSMGLRISEILGLKWKHVDLERGIIQVRERQYRGDQDITKTEKSERDVPIGDLVQEMQDLYLKDGRPAGEVFVFHDEFGQPLDDRNLNQHFLRKAAKRLGFYFAGLGFHSFRRGFITGAQEDGNSSIIVQNMAGHSKIDTTLEYTIRNIAHQKVIVMGRQKRLKKLA
ncbi:MAG TPA: tyrosine-type recombinase/integrase [Bryobacteraceae bacterium]